MPYETSCRRLLTGAFISVLVCAGTLLLATPGQALARHDGSGLRDVATASSPSSHRGQSARGKNSSDNQIDGHPEAASPDPKDKKKKSLFGDLPMGGFLTTLAIAVLIGATAGRVYVGVMGEKD